MKKLALFVFLIFGNLFLASTFSAYAGQDEKIKACARRIALAVATQPYIPPPPDSSQALQRRTESFGLPTPTEFQDVSGWESRQTKQLFLPRSFGEPWAALSEPWNTFLGLLHKRKPKEDCFAPSSNLTQLRREQWLYTLVTLGSDDLLETDIPRWNKAYPNNPMDVSTLFQTKKSRPTELATEIKKAEASLEQEEVNSFYGSPNPDLHAENMRLYKIFQRDFETHLGIYQDITGAISSLYAARLQKELSNLERRLMVLLKKRLASLTTLMENFNLRICTLEAEEKGMRSLNEQLRAERVAREALENKLSKLDDLEKSLSELTQRLGPFIKLLDQSHGASAS